MKNNRCKNFVYKTRNNLATNTWKKGVKENKRNSTKQAQVKDRTCKTGRTSQHK